jgi:hypothetical protein
LTYGFLHGSIVLQTSPTAPVMCCNFIRLFLRSFCGGFFCSGFFLAACADSSQVFPLLPPPVPRRSQAFTFAMDDDLDLRHEVHRQADVSGEFTERADGLGIHLLAFDFEADLFRKRGGDILRGDGTVQFAGFTCLGREAEGNFR